MGTLTDYRDIVEDLRRKSAEIAAYAAPVAEGEFSATDDEGIVTVTTSGAGVLSGLLLLPGWHQRVDGTGVLTAVARARAAAVAASIAFARDHPESVRTAERSVPEPDRDVSADFVSQYGTTPDGLVHLLRDTLASQRRLRDYRSAAESDIERAWEVSSPRGWFTGVRRGARLRELAFDSRDVSFIDGREAGADLLALLTSVSGVGASIIAALKDEFR